MATRLEQELSEDNMRLRIRLNYVETENKALLLILKEHGLVREECAPLTVDLPAHVRRTLPPDSSTVGGI